MGPGQWFEGCSPPGPGKCVRSLALLFTPADPPFSRDSLLQGLLGLILYQEVSVSLELP